MSCQKSHELQQNRDLTHNDKKTLAPESLTHISEKRTDEDGHENIKGWCVVVGSKHRAYNGYEKSDGLSLTVINDSTFSHRFH